MDASAIKVIQDTALAAHQKLDTTYPAIALPKDSSIFNLEQYQSFRNRYRGIMSTNCIADFADYSNAHCGQKCFIDAKEMCAITFFNLGDVDEPGHGDHKAVLSLEPTAAFKEILGINGKSMPQKITAEWLEDWRDYLDPKGAMNESTGDMESITIIKAIAAVRNITIKATREADHKEADFKASRGTLESIEATAKEQLPCGFMFTCIPYEGLPERKFFMRMSILTGGNEPNIKLRIVQLEKHQEEMARDLKVIFTAKLDADIQQYIGSFAL